MLIRRLSMRRLASTKKQARPSRDRAGATENAAAAKRLLTRLQKQGLPTDRKYLFVVAGV